MYGVSGLVEEHRLGLLVWVGVFSGLEGSQEGYVKHTQLQGEGRPKVGVLGRLGAGNCQGS